MFIKLIKDTKKAFVSAFDFEAPLIDKQILQNLHKQQKQNAKREAKSFFWNQFYLTFSSKDVGSHDVMRGGRSTVIFL